MVGQFALKLLCITTLKGVLNEMPANVQFNFSTFLLVNVVLVCTWTAMCSEEKIRIAKELIREGEREREH